MTERTQGRIVRSLSGFYDVQTASALVTCRARGILRKEGHEVANADFFKIGIPFTMSAVIPAYIVLWLLFGV